MEFRPGSTINEAIIDRLDYQISIMVKILKQELSSLEHSQIQNNDTIERMEAIKNKLKEVDNLYSYD